MAPAYKLTYFDVTALGEPIRFLLNYGGIEFEDVRLQNENWPTIKPNMPFGQVPILEHNGKVAHQSIAICRYLAKQVKLVGSNDWEDLEIDAVVDSINDVRAKLALYHYEQDEKIKETRAGPLFSEILPFYLGKFDELAKKNNGYLTLGRMYAHTTPKNVCNIDYELYAKLTWADMFLVGMIDYLNKMANKDITTDYANLQIVKNNVLELPNVKAWIQKRPKTAL